MLTARRLGPDDLPRVLPLLRSFFLHAGNPVPSEDALARFLEGVAERGDQFVFVGALDADELLGIASVARVESTYRLRPFAYCDDVFVVDHARGRGVGRLLLCEVRAVAAGWGATSVLCGADPEVSGFYERSGFSVMGSLLCWPIADAPAGA